MKPAPFDYVSAETVAHAVEALAAASGDGKVIAGGQSLMPMINFRMVRPSVLVDINRIAGLDRIEDRGDRFHIGALVRHRMTASDPAIARHVPVLHEAMKNVAHLTVRNRGTYCGSVCHADPAAELPMMTLLLNGTVHIASPSGERTLPAREFLLSSLTTALQPDELVTGIAIDKLPADTGWGFEEFARRHGDYALAAVVATVERRQGRAKNVRVAVMGVGDTAMRLPAVEAALEGSEMDTPVIAEAVARLREDIEPNSDLNGSAAYRRHLAGVLAGRVLKAAWERAEEEPAA
ncbi:xanthine dehydrogenase family protein subunit M [Rhizorhapis sp.]|uniref:FAD binding domain-containing protein n=1 Tax=Rhizorhapis sp. TaxID=1968842 RepID=UPI002B46098F|nr:xanthine dehydrogenase family protein subunit M [Rhizorhapis sp.]HKR17968.1 xanthine dehydrogenase family protein subunit M [Rhizorhapis sp.]